MRAVGDDPPFLLLARPLLLRVFFFFTFSRTSHAELACLTLILTSLHDDEYRLKPLPLQYLLDIHPHPQSCYPTAASHTPAITGLTPAPSP